MQKDKPTNPLLVPMFDELRGKRVIVRPYRDEDAADLQAAVAESREHIRPWLPFADFHQTVEESLTWIIKQRAQWVLRENMNCAIIDVQTGRFLGGTGLHSHGWGIPAFEIGYWLRASTEGKGYMSEAVQLLTDYAFDKIGAKRVMIQCDEKNVRSANVARRLGYSYEGLHRNDFLDPGGNVRNTLKFSLIPEEWVALKLAQEAQK